MIRETHITTDKQLGASSQNALISTGPKTPEGKVVGSINAVKHGIFAQDLVINTGDGRENEGEHYDLRSEGCCRISRLGFLRRENLCNAIKQDKVTNIEEI